MIVDLHAHYPTHVVPEAKGSLWQLLRTPLGRARLRDRVRALLVGFASRFINYRSLWSGPRVTMDSLREGQVRVPLSVLTSFFDELELGEPYPAKPKSSYLAPLLRNIEAVEQDIRERHAQAAVVAHSPLELERALDEGKVALVHCVEGGYHLGGTTAEVDRAVAELARRGVAYITVAHLVWRHVATNAPAIPFLPDWLYRRLFSQPEVGLSDLGEAAVRAMVRERVLVDLTHMGDRALADTFALLERLDGQHRVPVFASHGCFRFRSQEYGLSRGERPPHGRAGRGGGADHGPAPAQQRGAQDAQLALSGLAQGDLRPHRPDRGDHGVPSAHRDRLGLRRLHQAHRGGTRVGGRHAKARGCAPRALRRCGWGAHLLRQRAAGAEGGLGWNR